MFHIHLKPPLWVACVLVAVLIAGGVVWRSMAEFSREQSAFQLPSEPIFPHALRKAKERAAGKTASMPLTFIPLEPSEQDIGLKVFSLTASASGFSPDEIVVYEGDTIQLTVRSVGVSIDLEIPGLSTAISVPAGGEQTVSILKPKSGTFKFSCRSLCPGGREISGTIVVL